MLYETDVAFLRHLAVLNPIQLMFFRAPICVTRFNSPPFAGACYHIILCKPWTPIRKVLK